MLVKRKLQRLSICPCEYALLNDDIPVGAEYQLDTNTLRFDRATLICGGCGATTERLTTINTTSISDPTQDPRPLPIGLFL